MSEIQAIKLKVKEVIGTGDPTDVITLIPLISQWRVPRECAWVLTGEECGKPLSRLYVLQEPIQGHRIVGVCRDHHDLLTPPPESRNNTGAQI